MSARLAAQNNKILAWLKQRGNQGVTNAELSTVALKYTSRISDLRQSGNDIRCYSEGGGVYRYHFYGTVQKGQSRLFGDAHV